MISGRNFFAFSKVWPNFDLRRFAADSSFDKPITYKGTFSFISNPCKLELKTNTTIVKHDFQH
jgi:hypothetical protein